MPSDKATTEVENPENRSSQLLCGTCNTTTYHSVLTQVAHYDESDDGDIRAWARFQVVRCDGCRTISFCQEAECSEDWDCDAQGQMILNVTRTLYPSRVGGRSEIHEAYYLPTGVLAVYRETLGSFSNEFHVLTGIGIRAIVEAVCKQQGMDGRNLKEKIDSLASERRITPAGAAILHSLRFMGNDAAHEVKAHMTTELHAALDVVEYLLQGVYIIPLQAARLPKQEEV